MSDVHQSPPTSVGALLAYWRNARSLSQLALAGRADVSPRHLSFVETGRARPSRDMVMLLATELDVPLRERNALLLAAGFAPMYRETKLDAPELAPVQRALTAILRQQEPYPAVVLDRRWDIVDANAAARSFFGVLLGDARDRAPSNVLRLMFHRDWLRPFVANWEAVAESLVLRAHRETVGGVADPETTRVLREVLGYPDVPARLVRPNLATPLLPIVPVSFRKEGRAWDYFSAVTTLGTAQDVTVQELRIESFFPANAATEAGARA